MRTRAVRAGLAIPVVPLAVQCALLGALLWMLAPGPRDLGGVPGFAAGAGVGVAVACTVVGWVLLVRALAGHGRRSLGPADHVTVTRGTLACVVAALTTTALLDPASTGPSGPATRTPLVVLATVALLLDAVDGRVARLTRTATDLGARLDMEVDAFLILVLSVAASQVLGLWVLALGLFRYAFVLGTRVAPWLGGPVPPRYWRKAVAALQGIALTIASDAVLPRPLLVGAVGVALLLLAWSFATQGAELWRERTRSTPDGGRVGVVLPAAPVVDARPARQVRTAP